MIDIMFFVKTVALTVLLVLFMQIEIGEETIETHAMSWIHSTALAGGLQGVSRGGAKMVHDFSHKVSDSIHENVNKNKKGDPALKKDSPFHWIHSAHEADRSED